MKKTVIGATLVAVYGGILAVTSSTPTYGVLYTRLSMEDASAIKIKLQERKIRFRLSSDSKGKTIEIPANQVTEIRLDLAGLDLPRHHVNVGYEIFDKTSFGMTEAVQKINKRRATEGELNRTIKILEGVEDVSVHIAMPDKSDLAEDAKASVTVHMQEGYQLSAKQIICIKHIVASSVERLTPKKVVIFDSKGNSLNAPVKDPSLAY